MDALPQFSLINAASLDDVMKARAANPDARLLGGGTDLVVNIRRGIVAPPVLIDVTQVDELRAIKADAQSLEVGASVTLAELAHLAWEHFNGGVISHHFLNRADLPAISNAWGLLLLPALTWFLSGLALTRASVSSVGKEAVPKAAARVVAGFAGALLLGALLSVCFTRGYETAASSLFLGMFVLALLLRVYRAECVLGFVLGMTFTFGAVLPTIIGSIIAAISAAVHLAARPVLVRFLRGSKHRESPRS